MVPVRNAVSIPIHSVMTPRILPKTIKKETPATAAGTGSSTGSVTTGTGSTGTLPAATTVDPAANFKSLFGHALAPPAAVAPPKAAPPTLQSVFGGNPYATNPGGMAPNGVTYGYNPTYFATRAAADKLAQMYGGTVVEMNAITPYGPFQQNQMNEMIRFPNGNVVNAGILASYFDRGWSQDQINGAIAGEINQIPG